MTLLFFILQATPNLPSAPVGGTQQDWLGYAITMGVMALIGLITRNVEKKRDRKRYEKEAQRGKE